MLRKSTRRRTRRRRMRGRGRISKAAVLAALIAAGLKPREVEAFSLEDVRNAATFLTTPQPFGKTRDTIQAHLDEIQSKISTVYTDLSSKILGQPKESESSKEFSPSFQPIDPKKMNYEVMMNGLNTDLKQGNKVRLVSQFTEMDDDDIPILYYVVAKEADLLDEANKDRVFVIKAMESGKNTIDNPKCTEGETCGLPEGAISFAEWKVGARRRRRKTLRRRK